MPLKALSLRPNSPNDTTAVNTKPVRPNQARSGRSWSFIHKSQKSTNIPVIVRIRPGSNDSQLTGGKVIIASMFQLRVILRQAQDDRRIKWRSVWEPFVLSPSTLLRTGLSKHGHPFQRGLDRFLHARQQRLRVEPHEQHQGQERDKDCHFSAREINKLGVLFILDR